MGFSEKAPDFQNACLFRRHRNKKLRVADLLHASTEAFSWTRFSASLFGQTRFIFFCLLEHPLTCVATMAPRLTLVEQSKALQASAKDETPKAVFDMLQKAPSHSYVLLCPHAILKIFYHTLRGQICRIYFCLLACLLACPADCLLACSLAFCLAALCA